jgi:hypothetical protein
VIVISQVVDTIACRRDRADLPMLYGNPAVPPFARPVEHQLEAQAISYDPLWCCEAQGSIWSKVGWDRRDEDERAGINDEGSRSQSHATPAAKDRQVWRLASERRRGHAEAWRLIGLRVILAVLWCWSRLEPGDHYEVPSGSMLPTVRVGDHVLVSKLAYGIRARSSVSSISFEAPTAATSRASSLRRRGSCLEEGHRASGGHGCRGGRLWLNGEDVAVNERDGCASFSAGPSDLARRRRRAQLWPEDLPGGNTRARHNRGDSRWALFGPVDRAPFSGERSGVLAGRAAHLAKA